MINLDFLNDLKKIYIFHFFWREREREAKKFGVAWQEIFFLFLFFLSFFSIFLSLFFYSLHSHFFLHVFAMKQRTCIACITCICMLTIKAQPENHAIFMKPCSLHVLHAMTWSLHKNLFYFSPLFFWNQKDFTVCLCHLENLFLKIKKFTKNLLQNFIN